MTSPVPPGDSAITRPGLKGTVRENTFAGVLSFLRRRYTKATVTGDRLRYEVGATSKSTRNIQLTKVQDIRVDQGVFQRMLNIGNISIETSGETSRLTIPNVDRPQQICEDLMNRSQSGTPAA